VPATEALSEEPLPLAAEEASLSEPATVPPDPRRPVGEALEESSAESTTEDPPRPARAAPREGADDFGADDESDDDESDEPVEPPEPVVSANATGIDATAAPTPKATANAPTRPTNCE
jgi:hypothetical protein